LCGTSGLVTVSVRRRKRGGERYELVLERVEVGQQTKDKDMYGIVKRVER
jgi:hypothetical protein